MLGKTRDGQAAAREIEDWATKGDGQKRGLAGRERGIVMREGGCVRKRDCATKRGKRKRGLAGRRALPKRGQPHEKGRLREREAWAM